MSGSFDVVGRMNSYALFQSEGHSLARDVLSAIRGRKRQTRTGEAYSSRRAYSSTSYASRNLNPGDSENCWLRPLLLASREFKLLSNLRA